MLEQSRKQILNLFNIYSKCLFLNTLVICLQFIQDKHGETMRQCPQWDLVSSIIQFEDKSLGTSGERESKAAVVP